MNAQLLPNFFAIEFSNFIIFYMPNNCVTIDVTMNDLGMLADSLYFPCGVVR